MGLSTTYTKVETDYLLQQLEQKTSDKYTDETLAGDIIKRVDINTGENVNYRETTTWYDGSAMDDSKVDGVVYIKKNSKYYVNSRYNSLTPFPIELFEGSNDDERFTNVASLSYEGLTIECNGRYTITQDIVFNCNLIGSGSITLENNAKIIPANNNILINVAMNSTDVVLQKVANAISNIRSSSVNLCAYSFFDQRANYGYYPSIPDADSNAVINVLKDGRRCIHITGSKNCGFYANSNHSFRTKNDLIGRVVTISFDVFPNSQISKFKVGVAGSINTIISPSTVVGKWQRVSYQQIVPENDNRIFIFGGDISNDFYIANLCITNSDYMSDYYPSLDDLTIGLLSKNTKGWLDQLLPAGTSDFGSLAIPQGVPKIGNDTGIAHLAFNGSDLILSIGGVIYKLNKTAI